MLSEFGVCVRLQKHEKTRVLHIVVVFNLCLLVFKFDEFGVYFAKFEHKYVFFIKCLICGWN